jgi:hypothetical protein
MTGVKFLVRVTLRRLDLAAEIYHLREPQKIPQVTRDFLPWRFSAAGRHSGGRKPAQEPPFRSQTNLDINRLPA